MTRLVIKMNFAAYQDVILCHQLLERFHDVVEQVVHHIVVVLSRPIGQMTRAEYNYCVVATGLKISAMR